MSASEDKIRRHRGFFEAGAGNRLCNSDDCWCREPPTVRTPAMKIADEARAAVASGDISPNTGRAALAGIDAMQAADAATAEAASSPVFKHFQLLTNGRDVAMDALWIISRIAEGLSETDRGSVLCYVIARYTNEGKAK